MATTPQFAADQEKLPQSVAVAGTEPGFPDCVQQFLHNTILLAVTLCHPNFLRFSKLSDIYILTMNFLTHFL